MAEVNRFLILSDIQELVYTKTKKPLSELI